MDDTGQENRAKGLIDRINDDADAEIAVIRGQAETEAALVRSAARSRARRRVSAAATELRQMAERELRRTEAGLETERRQMHQARDHAALADGLSGLDGALIAQWNDADARATWCANLVAEAGNKLLPGQWSVALAPGLDDDGLDAIGAVVKNLTGQAPDISVDAALWAGLRITAGTACLDGTVAALTSGQTKLSALFLNELESIRQEGRA